MTERSDDGQPWFKRRAVVWPSLGVLVLLLAFGCWLGFQANAAKSNLEAARNSAQQAKSAVLQGNTGDASRFALDAGAHAQAARDAAHSLPWDIAAAVPWLGSPFETGQQIADVVFNLATDVLKPIAEAGTTVSPNHLLADGRLDVVALRNEEPTLRKFATDAARIDAEAQAISEPGYLEAIVNARSQLQAQTQDLSKLLTNTALAARLAPSMMGADGPRSYFMAFLTNAEARGTGGLLGGFGVVRFDDGKPSIDTLAPNTDFNNRQFTPLSLGPEFDNQYGFTNPSTDYRNTNQTSHFPYAAQIWRSMAQQAGLDVDGVMSIDPVALSYILGATGPVVLPDGETVTKDNAVELTESTVYIRYPGEKDQPARKKYLQGIAAEVVKQVLGNVKSPRALLEALGRAVSERRIAVWSSFPEEQALLEQTPLAHTIPDDAAPYAGIVINNLGGNKLDYYLDRRIEYVADGCSGATRRSTVTVRLKNNVTSPESLPDNVAGRLGFSPKHGADLIPKGTMFTSVRLLATTGAKLIDVMSNGSQIDARADSERGHPSFEALLVIPAGQTDELTFHLSEPTSPGAARVPIQPLVGPVTTKVSVPQCAG
ncbi:membrane protein [Mycobacterium sp. EPa45]|nr:membrane protein [Mycobacterium sp. EPa45]